MVATFSPHRDAGGTLHFPSPTHTHHVDTSSALVQLRNSLSRSPSKGPAFRLVTSKSTSPSPSSPLSPSPLSPQSRAASATYHPYFNILSPSSSGTPFPASARKSRSGTRRLSPPRPTIRSASAQRGPVKRGLSDSVHNGNATPPSTTASATGVENKTPSGSPGNKDLDAQNACSIHGTSGNLLAPHHALTRRDTGSGYLTDHTKSSSLKRSDGTMNFDLTSLESPSAKRRSLHGASFGTDFNIFDHEAGMQPCSQMDPQRFSELPASEVCSEFDPINFLPSMSKRASSLRKTTLQQRYEKPIHGRSKPAGDSITLVSSSGQTTSKPRQRMSLDNVLPPSTRDSPFSSHGCLPSASAHPLTQRIQEQSIPISLAMPSRHPLSRTITQSSSSSSLAEDSPTHIPLRHSEARRPSVDFTKSLLVGGARPASKVPFSRESTIGTSSTETSFATPENYKLARPLPAAFMSTGLISKRNKDMHPEQLDLNASVASMPDTPCKRPASMISSTPQPAAGNSTVKLRQGRHSLHSFGTPSTPFNPHTARPSFGSLARGVSIFGSSYSGAGLPRRSSFLSVDGDEGSASPSMIVDSQSSNDMEVPPTPTKQGLPSTPAPAEPNYEGDSNQHPAINAEARQVTSFQSPHSDQRSKLSPAHTPAGSADGDSDRVMEDSPSTTLRFRSLNAVSSFSNRPHLLGHSQSPTPMSRKSLSIPFIRIRKMKTKPSPLSPASPNFDRREQHSPHTPRTPHTPQGSMLPPDPSGLSISACGDRHAIQNVSQISFGSFAFLPATPTTSKDQATHFGKSHASMTPMHNPVSVEIDTSLLSKFAKVEIIGTGEFSQVFRVMHKAQTGPDQDYFPLPTAPNLTQASMPERVWAVKKTRQAFIGPRDRRQKLQEVEVLKALGRSDHTVAYFDSWEFKGHLYIQTEYCEEGSLDLFLDQVGRKARLDDFRIWKIMLEMSLGLKHIHDRGFIHLDLKPANVLITFEGVLKIGDFGMATSWPAQPGIDGEGDREYIGPEILMGQYDKPADIFALGLIMLEIAGNVMLPDNGASWQRLRSGDMSDVPSLTSSSETSNVLRDSTGKPLSRAESFDEMSDSDFGRDTFESPHARDQSRETELSSEPRFQLRRCGELSSPPEFMADPTNEQALDKIVRWMIAPQPSERPVVSQILNTTGVRWAEARRRAGATIYEGNWGPADEILLDDAEMLDV